MTKPLVVLICGGRDQHPARVSEWLTTNLINRLYDRPDLWKDRAGLFFVHGAARGADTGAARYAKKAGYGVTPYPINRANGETGFQRNRRMFESALPDLVIAFPGNAGTEDMITIANDHGCPVIEIKGDFQ